MNTVFIGGSRSISRLNKKLKNILNVILDKNLTVLIGDANGADKAIQDYLLNKNYKNVLVYYMENKCRNNLGNWDTVPVNTDIKDKTYKYYFVKDLHMARASQYGFMLWDSKSKGTLNNIMNLLKDEKPTVVYFSPTKEILTLNNLTELDNLLNKCDQQTINKLDSVLSIYENCKEKVLAHSVNETQSTFNF
jgi:hypothetical protein